MDELKLIDAVLLQISQDRFFFLSEDRGFFLSEDRFFSCSFIELYYAEKITKRGSNIIIHVLTLNQNMKWWSKWFLGLYEQLMSSIWASV